MTNRLKVLRTDHTNFKRLLGLLDAEIARFQKGVEPDYVLMRDALHYMTQYADRVHHPAEDVIFERLLKLDSSLKPAITEMLVEHERLVASGSELLQVLEEVLGDAVMSRDAVTDTARKYLDAMRAHIDKEERTLFPLAEMRLKAADWAAIEAQSRELPDPLFGTATDPRYRAIVERLPKGTPAAYPPSKA